MQRGLDVGRRRRGLWRRDADLAMKLGRTGGRELEEDRAERLDVLVIVVAVAVGLGMMLRLRRDGCCRESQGP